MFNKSPSAFLECWTSFCTSWTRAWPSIVCEIRVSMQAYSAKNLKSSKCMSLTSVLIWLLQLCSLTILTGRTYKMIHWTQQTFDWLLTQKLNARLFACSTTLTTILNNTNSFQSEKMKDEIYLQVSLWIILQLDWHCFEQNMTSLHFEHGNKSLFFVQAAHMRETCSLTTWDVLRSEISWETLLCQLCMSLSCYARDAF